MRALPLLLALSCADKTTDTADVIVASCRYTAADDRAPACLNRWGDSLGCPAVTGLEGAWVEGEACAEGGFAYPCTPDHPSSLWVTDEADCAAWDEALTASP